MSNFEIKITTPAELSGAKQLAEQLEINISKAKALGQATDELEGKLASVSGAIEGAGEAAKKGAEGTGEFLEGHHGIHAIGHGLNEAMPGLMQFTRFLTSGFTASIGVAVLAFSYLKDKIEEFSKTLDEISTGPGARGEWAEKIRDNVHAAAAETAIFNERLRETVTAQETLAQSTDALIARQKEQAADARAVGDAQKELDLARLELAEKLHQITPDQAVLIRLQIDDAAFKRELEAKKAEIQAELSARQNENNANEGREPGLRANMEQAGVAALATENARDKNSAKLAQDKTNLEASQKSYEVIEQKLEELSHISLSKLLPFDLMEKKALESQKSQQENIMGGLRRTIGQEQGRETPLAQAAATAKEQADKAKADYEEAAKLAHDTLETIQKLKADLAAANARSGALQNIHNQTSAVRRAGVAADAANHVAEGHGAPDEIDQTASWHRQADAAHERGPQAGVDASAAITQGRNILATLQGQGGRAQPQQMGEVHAILDQILGFLSSHDAYVQSSGGDLQDIANRLSALEQRTDNNRTIH